MKALVSAACCLALLAFFVSSYRILNLSRDFGRNSDLNRGDQLFLISSRWWKIRFDKKSSSSIVREEKAVTHVGLMENVENYDDCHYFYEDEVSILILMNIMFL